MSVEAKGDGEADPSRQSLGEGIIRGGRREETQRTETLSKVVGQPEPPAGKDAREDVGKVKYKTVSGVSSSWSRWKWKRLKGDCTNVEEK